MLCFFFCRPHAGAHGGFWKNLLPVPLPHTQPTRRHKLALAVNSLEERFVKQARNRRFDSWPVQFMLFQNSFPLRGCSP